MAQLETYTIASALAGVRLDRALAGLMPGTGLRLRRRLCDAGLVAVDGRARGPAYKVKTGQMLSLLAPETDRMAEPMPEDIPELCVVERADHFAAVYKPGGLHSAAIAGKGGLSVEAALPALFPGAAPVLLNRLDFPTSGLLLVALGPDGSEAYRASEETGEVRKFYLAVVHGRLDGMISVRSRLDTDDRRKTRVLDEEDGDMRRWTDVTALAHDHDRDTTRVRCLIMKGARHQIRAHLASLGHPIVGDTLYGNPDIVGSGGVPVLHLHHQRIELPDFSAEADPPW
jgi:23S rRNA pseudouridine1911/1915/1917 synthase